MADGYLPQKASVVHSQIRRFAIIIIDGNTNDIWLSEYLNDV